MKPLKVVLSIIAQRKLTQLTYYLEHEFSESVKNDFIGLLKEKISQVSRFPLSCPKSNKMDIYKAVVTKQCTFYYRLTSDEVQIITIFDNRQNPDQIQSELNF